MYQYKAQLLRSKEVIAEGHTIEDVEHQVVIFQRKNQAIKNQQIEIVHSLRDKVRGTSKDVVVKII